MGRVRKYKKFKACDPFAKRTKSEVDTTHDEPPDLFEEREHRSNKRKERFWEDDNANELMLQREGIRSLKESEKKKLVNDRKIEGKKQDESMKDFKTRIRQETRNTLRDELKGMSATSKKRKERLKERKLKRKGLPGKVIKEEYEEGFSSAANGHLRPSDTGGSEEFAKPEVFRFGERSERPPELKGLLKFTEKPLLIKKQQEQLRRSSVSSPTKAAEGGGKKKRKVAITSIASMDGEDGLGLTNKNKGMRDGIIFAGNGSGKSTASAAEFQDMREKVQAAYKALQEKRRAAL